jgi:hypothetical protein
MCLVLLVRNYLEVIAVLVFKQVQITNVTRIWKLSLENFIVMTV